RRVLFRSLPSDAAKLREELNKRSLTLCSAFVAIPLGNRAARSVGLAQVLTTARLVSAVGCRLLVLSHEISAARCAVAGRREEANRVSWKVAERKVGCPAVIEVVARCTDVDVGLEFYGAVHQGVFAPLGQGVVDFAKILALLCGYSFSGWIVVEQDVLAGGARASNPLENAVAGRKFLKTLGY